jgi:hypothetical protein
MTTFPVCDICGQPPHRHMRVDGVGDVCPASGFTYRAKSAPALTAERMRLGVIAFRMEMAQIECDAQIGALTDDEIESIVHAVLATMLIS